ncbi:MAG: hypothetical protein AB1491_10415 [Thermodesulfobacteriota bacterium]
MKEQNFSAISAVYLEQARELMAQGKHQEALILALNVLQNALTNLRDSLLSLQYNLAKRQATLSPSTSAREIQEFFESLTLGEKPEHYH